MNNALNRIATIRTLNDRFRQTLSGGVVLMTRGVLAMGPDVQAQILAAVRAFDAFDEENDPWGEHDFGALEVDTKGGSGSARVFFKIEYYDLTRARHADDPTDPTRTERVMTIMLADEY